MHRVPFIFLGAPLQQRKIRYPKKIPVRARHETSPSNWRTGQAFCDLPTQILNLGHAQPNPAEHFAGDLPFICGEESIRDVMAFPKNNRGLDLMTQSPADVDPRQLRDLGIKLAKEKL